MLELIRKYSKSIVVKIFLTILAGSFGLFFGLSYIVDKIQGKDYVVKVGNIKIPPNVYKYEKDNRMNIAKRRKEKVDEKEISKEILRQIIWENVITLGAEEYGILVSEATLFSFISNMEFFRKSDGHFDAALLRRFLSRSGMSEKEFLQNSKRNITNHIMQAPFRYIALGVENEYFLRAGIERRRIKFFEIDPNLIKITETPTDEDLEDFYNNDTEKFEIPEKRSFVVLIMGMDKVEKETVVTPEEIEDRARDYYTDDYSEENLKKFKSTDEYQILRQEKIAAAAEEITRQIEDDLVAGDEIDDIVKRYDLKKVSVNDVMLEEEDKIDLPFSEDVLTMAFGSDEKEVGNFTEGEGENKKVVQWLVYVTDITPKTIAPLEKVKDKVKSEWIKDKQYTRALEIADTVVSKTSEGEDFGALVKKEGYKVKTSDLFDKDGRVDNQNNSNAEEEAKKKEKEKEKKKKKKKNKYGEEEIEKTLLEELASDCYDKVLLEAGQKEVKNKIVVYQVSELDYTKQLGSDDRQRYYVELIEGSLNDMYQQLITHLSKKYEVNVNRAQLEQSDDTIDLSVLDETF